MITLKIDLFGDTCLYEATGVADAEINKAFNMGSFIVSVAEAPLKGEGFSTVSLGNR